MGRTIKLRVLSAKGLPANEKEIRLKVFTPKDSVKTKYHKSNDIGSVDFQGEILEVALSKDKQEMRIELYIKKKSIAAVLLTNLASLTTGEEVLKSFDMQGKALLNIGITIEGFANESATEIAPQTSSAGMPDKVQLDAMYKKLMEELGINESISMKASEISDERKWAMINQNKKLQDLRSKGRIEGSPQYLANKIKIEPSVEILKELQAVLATESLDWIKTFIESDGLAAILDLLGEVEQVLHMKAQSRTLKKQDPDVKLQGELINCLKPITNNQTGLEKILSVYDGVKKIALCLDFAQIPGWIDNVEWAKSILRTLTLLCLIKPPESHQFVNSCVLVYDDCRAVLEAMDEFKLKKKENMRFQTLIKNFKSSVHLDVKVAYMSFINTLINTPSNIDTRVSIRNEFLRLGLKEFVDELKAKCDLKEDIELITQLDVFEEESTLDFKELRDQFAMLNVDASNVQEIFNKLVSETNAAGLEANFLSLMQSLLCLPVRTQAGAKSLMVAAKVLRHIVVNKDKIMADEEKQQTSSILSDVSAASGKSIEQDVISLPLQKKLRELMDEIEKQQKLIKTLELELKEKESALQKQGGSATGSGTAPLETKKETKPTDSIATVPGSTTDATAPASTGTPMDSFTDGPPPPPPPGLDGPPPPPGAPAPPGAPMSPTTVPKKLLKVAPKQKMKGLQWTKIIHNKIKGTIFENFPAQYKDIDLDYQDIEDTFAAKVFEKKQQANEEKDNKVVQILDHKTSQNLSIFLSPFKQLSHTEIIKNILELNETMFSLQQIKDLMTFIPSANDVQAITDHVTAYGDSKLAPPELFSVAMTKVPGLELRLQCFKFKLSFYPTKADIKPDLETLKTACLEITNSDSFAKVVELILELGNFLNAKTPRGDAFGFTLQSLLKIQDTKSSDLSINLMHYLASVIQTNASELSNFYDEMPSIVSGSKITLTSLVENIKILSTDWSASAKAVEQIKSLDSSDKFVTLMTEFLAEAKKDIDGMSAKLAEVTEIYNKTAAFFGEDGNKVGPDQLFTIVSSFIDSFKSAASELSQKREEKEKKMKREEAKVKREKELMAKKLQSQGEVVRDHNDAAVNELMNALGDGQIFKLRRAKQHSKQLDEPKNPLPT